MQGSDRAGLDAVASLARDAAVVFRGRCLDALPVRVPVGDGDVAATEYRFRVLEAFRGDLGETVTFRQLGRPSGGADDLGERAGLPRYEPGGDYVLLLLPASAAGLTSPAGAAEGAFQVEGGEAIQVLPRHGRRLPDGALHDRRLPGAALGPIRLPLAELARIVGEEGRP